MGAMSQLMDYWYYLRHHTVAAVCVDLSAALHAKPKARCLSGPTCHWGRNESNHSMCTRTAWDTHRRRGSMQHFSIPRGFGIAYALPMEHAVRVARELLASDLADEQVWRRTDASLNAHWY